MLQHIVSLDVRAVSAAYVLLLGSCTAQVPQADIVLEDGWVRETVAGQSSAAAYLTIINRSAGEDRLTGVSSPAAVNASFHSTTHDGGIARMRAVDEVVVPSDGSITFRPAGNHVMLTGLKQPLTFGSLIELRLRFQRSGERKTALRVMSAGGASPHVSH